MTEPATYDEKYTRYQTDRSAFRRMMRRLYLFRAARELRGPTLDFGCGVGELLKLLAPGSVGLEYNKDTVSYCASRGQDVRWYDGFEDDWSLSCVASSRFQSMVLSHVLEHFDRPADILNSLLEAASRLGVERVLIVVPGIAGYRSDPTHRTFIDKSFLEEALRGRSNWAMRSDRHFPLNVAWVGKFFVHHELQIVLARSDS